MVRELHVEDPSAGKVDWETETELLHDMVYLGIELPENLVEQRRERLGWTPSERPPEAALAEKLWDAYHVWLAGKPELENVSPSKRLSLYAAQLTLQQEE